ncbi:MAG: hypothetical protein AAF458_13850 [Pseudomonadota bacterium]
MDFFSVFGLIALIYAAWCLFTGEVSGAYRTRWVTHSRRDSPVRYWLGVVSYGAIGVFALFVVPALKH